MFNLLSNYYLYYGTLRMFKNFKTLDGINYSPDGHNLQVWLKCQKKLYNNTFKSKEERNKNYGVLTIEQIAKLESIEVDFSRCKVNINLVKNKNS